MVKSMEQVGIDENLREDLLNSMVQAGIRGDFKKGWEISEELLKNNHLYSDGNNRRAAFNRGWYLLQQGKLLEGHVLLDNGRHENIFGNKHIETKSGIYRLGNYDGTVLLYLEGGIGDQINGYRWAFDLEKRGHKVFVSCAPEICNIFSEKFITVEHQAVLSVYHDWWVPSMSAISILEYEYEDIKGTPYIERTSEAEPGRIGVRWSGNPKFEHEQHRLFPPELMFDAVKGFNCVSLQRDKDEELRPEWMATTGLGSWKNTRFSISKCELVITSCTSVAHLAAAMGIETWIVVPILSYYLWSLPGNKSPFYDSVTLYRQKEYGDWTHPFEQIRKDLEKRKWLKK